MGWNNTPKHVTTTTRRRILNRDGHQCATCGTTHGPFDIDHINNQRGPNYNKDTNLQVLCQHCHRTKTRSEINRGKERKRARRHLPRAPHPGLS